MPFAWRLVQASLAEIGGEAKLRKGANGEGLAVTSYGSLVLDATFESDADSRVLNGQLDAIPGIIEHGIFSGLATAIFCGHEVKVLEQWR